MIKLLSLLIVTRLVLFLVDKEWLTTLVKMILGLLLLQFIGKTIRVLPDS